MLFTLVYLILILMFFVINTHFFKKKSNYLNWFMTFFFGIAMLANIAPFGFARPILKTNIYIIVSLFVFELFSLFFLSIKGKNTNEEKIEVKSSINWKALSLLSLVILILLLPKCIEGTNIILEYGFTKLRADVLVGDLYSNYTKIFINYILQPTNTAIFIYSLIYYFRNKKIKLSLVFSLINIIQIVLIFAGRNIIFNSILLILIVSFCESKINIFELVKRNKKVVLIILAAVLSIVMITGDRSLKGDSSILFNGYSYFSGSIHLFDYHVKNPKISLLDDDHLLYGKGMFSPIGEFGNLVLKAVHKKMVDKTGIEIINEVTQKYYKLNNGTIMNNNVTFIYTCLRDFGILGLIIGPLLLSCLYSYIYKKQKKSNTVLNKSMYYYLCSILPYLVFEFYFNRLSVIMTIIIIFIFNTIIVSKQKTNK